MTEKSFERGHSWNVNTQKESSIFRSSGLCHASIFLLFFFSVCILVRQTEDGTLQLHCYLLWSPLFCLSLWSPLRPCHVFGQCFCDLHANNNTSILLCVYVKFHSVFSLRQGGKSWIMIRAFVPLDCVVAVADVGLLCWESWKRRMRGAIESPAESRLSIVTYGMRQARAYVWTCFPSLTAENECSGAV